MTSNVVAPTQVLDGSSIQVSYTVANLGAGDTIPGSWTDTIWLTLDRTRPDPRKGDVLLGTFGHSGTLSVGDSYDQSVTVSLPSGISGNYYVTPWTDSYDQVPEDTFDININPDDPTQLDNNNYKARPITVLLRPPPPPTQHIPSDLVVTSVQPTAQARGRPVQRDLDRRQQGDCRDRFNRLDRYDLPLDVADARRGRAMDAWHHFPSRRARCRCQLYHTTNVPALACGRRPVRHRPDQFRQWSVRRPEHSE